MCPRGEGIVHLQPRARQSRLNIGFGDAQRLRGFLNAELLDIAQHEHAAILLRQRGQRLGDLDARNQACFCSYDAVAFDSFRLPPLA
jgi:hypothetical protein